MADDLIARCEALLGALGPVLSAAAPAVPALGLTGAIAVPEAPATLPVLATLAEACERAPDACRAFVARLRVVASQLAWRQTYRAGEVEDAFLRGYGWTELVGANGLIRQGDVSAGLLLLGPRVTYPSHQHPALEHYVPLSGLADWYDEDHGWRRVAPLTTVVHRSQVRHAMRTGDEPLLAYFHWSGDGVDVSARLSQPDG